MTFDFLRPARLIKSCGAVTAAALLMIAAGCGGPVTSVHGTVTYDGKPISRGVITIDPANGRGKGEGSKILDGVYEVKTIEPGSKKISVMGVIGGDMATPTAASSDDKAAVYGAQEGGRQPGEIPLDAEGQGQTIEINEGEQEINIELTAPPTGRRR